MIFEIIEISFSQYTRDSVPLEDCNSIPTYTTKANIIPGLNEVLLSPN